VLHRHITSLNPTLDLQAVSHGLVVLQYMVTSLNAALDFQAASQRLVVVACDMVSFLEKLK
jgi:hypothetical protein